jgi:hypothetical protein
VRRWDGEGEEASKRGVLVAGCWLLELVAGCSGGCWMLGPGGVDRMGVFPMYVLLRTAVAF